MSRDKDSEIEIDWSRQITRLIEDQTRLRDEMRHLKESTQNLQQTTTKCLKESAGFSARFDDVCSGIRGLYTHLGKPEPTAVQPQQQQKPEVPNYHSQDLMAS